MDTRLSLALEAGHVTLPDEGRILVLGARGQSLAGLPKERLLLVVDDVISARAYEAQGYTLADAPEPAALAVVLVPRGRAEGRVMFAQGAAAAGRLVVDGMKTDGVDSHYKELKKRGAFGPAYSKAHGKVFEGELTAESAADWAALAAPSENGAGFLTVPGVFSEAKADEGSRLLAEALPEKPGKHVVDLGAGWGYLARSILEREAVEQLHLVEASRAALDCAKLNVNDARAQYHWADATGWKPAAPLDAVVMNPPFHAGRKGVPELGQAFIATAAACLKGSGQLWMVANRHLPYEEVLRARFGFVEEIGGNTRFKLIHAAKPSRKR